MRTNKIQNSLSVSHPQMSGKDQCATNHIALCNVRGTAVDRVEWSVMGVGGTGEESLAARSGGWCRNTCAVRKLHHVYLAHTYSLGNKEPSWHSGNDEGEGWWWWWWWCWMAGQWAGRIVTRAGMCPLKPVLYMEQCKLWCNLLQYPCNICVAFMQYLCIVSAISCAIFLQYVCFLSWCSFYFLISYGKEEPYFSKFIFPLPCVPPLVWNSVQFCRDCCKWIVSCVQPVDPHF